MRSIFIILFCFVSSTLLFIGCEKEDLDVDVVTSVDVDFEGLKVKTLSDGVILTAQVDSKLTIFKSYEQGKTLGMGYISYILVQNSDEKVLDEVDFKPRIYEPDFKPQMSYESDYISMHYLTENPPYEIAYEIKENLSNQPRIITIEYGDKRTFRYTKLTITQTGR